ncbi:hypothetical protein Tco_0489123 [Tanacetum coccineum]
MQTQDSKIYTGKALDADLVDTESIRTDSTVQDDNNRSGNDTDADDADIRPIYDEEPMVEYPETCQVKSPMLDSSPDSQTTEYSKQSLESKNILLKETVAQFQKDFSRMEAHCIALELKYQNQALKSGQHGQILNETSNKAKIEKEIDVLETMNIELKHSVAKLRKENETLKQHYKDLYDSIKITRSMTTEQTTSLLANNAELKAQIQEKVFAIAALRNDLRKFKGNRKLFDSCTSKVDSKPPNGSNVDIPNIHEFKQILDVSAGTSVNVQKEQSLDLSAASGRNHCQSGFTDDDTEKWRQITSVLTPVHNVRQRGDSSLILISQTCILSIQHIPLAQRWTKDQSIRSSSSDIHLNQFRTRRSARTQMARCEELQSVLIDLDVWELVVEDEYGCSIAYDAHKSFTVYPIWTFLKQLSIFFYGSSEEEVVRKPKYGFVGTHIILTSLPSQGKALYMVSNKHQERGMMNSPNFPG